MRNKIRVGIVDVHKVVRDALKILLETTDDLIFVGEAHSEAGILLLCEQAHPNVILLDFLQSEEQSLKMIEHLVYLFPSVSIIILTAIENPLYITWAIQTKLAGYLLKDVGIDVITNSVRSAYKGLSTFDVREQGFPN